MKRKAHDLVSAGRCGLCLALGCVVAGCRPATGSAETHAPPEEAKGGRVSRTAGGEAAVRVDVETQERIGLKVETLRASTDRSECTAFGRLEEDPAWVFMLRAPVPGFLRSATGRTWPALGDHLTVGEAVGWIEPRLTPVERIDLATRPFQARAEAEEAVAALSVARASWESMKTLNAGNKVVSDRALEAAEAKVKSQEARYNAAAHIISLGDEVPRVPLSVAEEGEVVAIGARPDEAAEAGQLLLKIARYDHLLARVEFPVGEAIDLTATAARFELVGDESASIDGHLVAHVAADSGAMACVGLYRIDRQGLPLRPGQAVIARLPGSGGMQTGVVVPRSAVVRTRGKAWVYVRTSEDAFVRRELAVFVRVPDGWLATSGFSAGDPIVVEGAHALLSEELKETIEQEEAAAE